MAQRTLIAGSIIPDKTNTPLDARSRISVNSEEFDDIRTAIVALGNPFEGQIVYNEATSIYYSVKSVVINEQGAVRISVEKLIKDPAPYEPVEEIITEYNTLKVEPDAYLRNVQYNIENNNVSYVNRYISNTIIANRSDQPYPVEIQNVKRYYIYDNPIETFTAKYFVLDGDKYYNLIPGFRYFYRDQNNEKHSFILHNTRRFIWADNVVNIRDLGGIPTTTVGNIAYDKIIRGSEVDGYLISGGDVAIEALRALKVTLELDLRTDGETIGGHQTTSAFATKYKRIPFIRFEEISTLDDSEKAKIKEAFETVANEITRGGKVYIHCKYGYHRCGFLATLIEGILGATQYEIDKDYELSSFSPLGLVKRTDDNYKNGIAAINSQYDGSWIKFAKTCGISEELISSFRKAMVVEKQNEQVSQYNNVTYEDLKNMRDNSLLIPGAKYRMIDFDTYDGSGSEIASCSGIPDLPEFKSAYHHFDLLLTAISKNELDCNVKALHSSRDTEGYFTNLDLNKWELKYDIDNNKDKYTWAVNDDVEGVHIEGKGVIYYIKDEYNNELPYDFKNILFKYDGVWVNTFSNYEYVANTFISNPEFSGSLLPVYKTTNDYIEYCSIEPYDYQDFSNISVYIPNVTNIVDILTISIELVNDKDATSAYKTLTVYEADKIYSLENPANYFFVRVRLYNSKKAKACAASNVTIKPNIVELKQYLVNNIFIVNKNEGIIKDVLLDSGCHDNIILENCINLYLGKYSCNNILKNIDNCILGQDTINNNIDAENHAIIQVRQYNPLINKTAEIQRDCYIATAGEDDIIEL